MSASVDQQVVEVRVVGAMFSFSDIFLLTIQFILAQLIIGAVGLGVLWYLHVV